MKAKDKKMFEELLKDKGVKYRIVIDNDSVYVLDKTDEDADTVHNFDEFGDYLLKQVFEHLGLDAEFC
jgi:hypothetical protein